MIVGYEKSAHIQRFFINYNSPIANFE